MPTRIAMASSPSVVWFRSSLVRLGAASDRLGAMAGFTKRNLRTEIDDQAQAFGFSPNLEFRVARDALETTESALSFMRLAPGFRVPFGHHHELQEEVYVIIRGSAHLKLDEEILDLGPWDAVRIAPGVVRDIEGGADGAELLLFGAPRVPPGDAVTEQDWWRD
jgi:mannose-6-phosphate isomerase-like protein (cupin superfamily)